MSILGSLISFGVSEQQIKAEEKIQSIKTGAQRIEDAANIRRQAREARIQRSRILAAAEASGGGSREGTAISALSTQLSEQKSRVAGQQSVAQNIGALNRKITDLGVIQSGIKTVEAIAGAAAGQGSGVSGSGGFDNLFKD